MLDAKIVSADLHALRSPRMAAAGVPHAFGTRHAAGTTGALDLAVALDLEHARLHTLTQVHGATVHRPAPLGEEPDGTPEADALVSDREGDLLAVETADCVPVLVATADGAEVAAIHAGWRGLLAGVISETLGEMLERPKIAAIGPCLSAERFEVSPDVARQFEAAGWRGQVLDDGVTRPRIDLRSVAREQLRAAGVTAIDVAAECTWEDEALFFSHRRDVTHGELERTGRHLAFIAPRPRNPALG